MFNSDIIADKNNESSKIHLEMIDKIKSNDILYESLLWYADHTYLIPENKRFEQIYDKFKLKERFTGSGPDSMFLGYFNPLGFNFDEMIELFENKDEESKAVTELTSFAVVSKVDISGGIDTWRHTRVNRMIEPIYHAIDRGATATMPVLYQRKERSGSDLPGEYLELSNEAIDLYKQLVNDGVPQKKLLMFYHTILNYYKLK